MRNRVREQRTQLGMPQAELAAALPDDEEEAGT